MLASKLVLGAASIVGSAAGFLTEKAGNNAAALEMDLECGKKEKCSKLADKTWCDDESKWKPDAKIKEKDYKKAKADQKLEELIKAKCCK